MVARRIGKLFCVITSVAALASPIVVIAGDLPSAAAATKGAIRLEGSSPWNLEFDDNRCRLIRLFGSPEEPNLLMLEQAAPDDEFGLTLAGPAIKKFRQGSWIDIGLLGDVPMADLEGEMRGEIKGVGPAIILPNVRINIAKDGQEEGSQLVSPGIDLDQANKIERIVLKVGSTVASFETGSMGPPIQALNVCTTDLLEAWGLDPVSHLSYTPPRWANSDVIVPKIQRSYPTTALNRGEQAIVRLRVIVEIDGSVSDCLIESSTVNLTLESPACKSMLEARFEPARDAEGVPIRSFYSTTIRYVI